MILLKVQGQDVFFQQPRVGKNLQPFNILKFTTMHKGSEKFGSLTLGNDSRVTLTGRILRKLKLNELPQLINVLKGEMSFVGPRPLTKNEVEKHYSKCIRSKIYSVKPGITGCGSLEFNQEESDLENCIDPNEFFATVIMPKKAELECWYIDNQSFWLDLSILYRTVFRLGISFVIFFLYQLKKRLQGLPRTNSKTDTQPDQ